MGILSKILKARQREEAPAPPVETEECPHVALVPHWENLDDMGKPDRVAWYVCDACHHRLTPEEAVERGAAIGGG